MPLCMPIIPSLDHYAVLGVREDASQDEIERAYRATQAAGSVERRSRLAWVIAAWLGRTPQARLKAYRTLSDPMTRARFDAQRKCQAAVWVGPPC